MKNILAHKHSILILYEILYCKGSIEFVSELIEKIKKLNGNSQKLELKNKVKDYLSFLIMNDFIYIKHGKSVYNKKNIQDFFKIIEEEWDKFENKNNVNYNHFWYGYLIEYSEKWIEENRPKD